MHTIIGVKGLIHALCFLLLFSWSISKADQLVVTEQASPTQTLSYGYDVGVSLDSKLLFSTSEPLAAVGEPLLGIYLGPSQLTSSYYTELGDPILLAKIEASYEWRSHVFKRSQEDVKDCFQEEFPNPDQERGTCGEIIPAFIDAMSRITEVSANTLNRTYKIGYIVIPHNMIDYEPILDEVMHGIFPFYHKGVEPRDLVEYDIIRLGRAAQYAYNLTNPDALGAPWATNGRTIWDTFGEGRLQDVFADLENYILLVNFELDFLELAYICVQRACDEVPRLRTTFPELGEEALWGLKGDEQGEAVQDHDVLVPLSAHFGSRVRRLSRAISGFMNGSEFKGQRELLRAVVLTGGASQAAMDALKYALRDALPYVETWRFKTSIDPAFVPSLGAAFRIHNKEIIDRYRD